MLKISLLFCGFGLVYGQGEVYGLPPVSNYRTNVNTQINDFRQLDDDSETGHKLSISFQDSSEDTFRNQNQQLPNYQQPRVPAERYGPPQKDFITANYQYKSNSEGQNQRNINSRAYSQRGSIPDVQVFQKAYHATRPSNNVNTVNSQNYRTSQSAYQNLKTPTQNQGLNRLYHQEFNPQQYQNNVNANYQRINSHQNYRPVETQRVPLSQLSSSHISKVSESAVPSLRLDEPTRHVVILQKHRAPGKTDISTATWLSHSLMQNDYEQSAGLPYHHSFHKESPSGTILSTFFSRDVEDYPKESQPTRNSYLQPVKYPSATTYKPIVDSRIAQTKYSPSKTYGLPDI